MVLRVWEEKKANVAMERSGYSEQLTSLEMRKARIVEMRADDEIDKDTYKRMRADVESRIAAIKISENEAEVQKLDLETRLERAEHHIRNLAGIWQELSIERQIRLQKVVLPSGLEYDKTKERFGTALLSPYLGILSNFPMEESVLVAGPGIDIKFLVHYVHKNSLARLIRFYIMNSKNFIPHVRFLSTENRKEPE